MNIDAAQFALSLFLLWLLVFVCWRSYRVDRLREQLFTLRNELFDYAAGGGISFDSDAYAMLRNTMNGLIQKAEHVSFFRYMVISVGEEVSGEYLAQTAFERWRTSVASLPEAQRNGLLEFNRRLNDAMVGNLVLGSPLLWAVVLIAFFATVVPHLKNRIVAFLQRSANVIEAQALAEQECPAVAA